MSLGYLEDRLAINDLFVRYTTALDRGDVETLVDCFTPDAALDSPAVGRHAGHAAIRAFAERFARFHEAGAQLRHVISNLAVEIDGDHARATCYLLNVLTRDGKSQLLAPGPLRMRARQERRPVALPPPRRDPRPRDDAGRRLKRGLVD